MRKLLSIIIALSILVTNTLPQQALAQEITPPPASPSTTTDSTFSDEAFDIDTHTIRREIMVEQAINSLTQNPGSISSNNKKLPKKVRKLLKKSFKLTEKVPVTIENDQADKVKVEVFNVDGEKINAEVQILTVSQPATLWVIPPSHFKPGRYRLKITDSEGTISTQDFTWGVLAINTNKSIFQQNDIARLHMAVLDETGNMVCDAKVKLTIKDPTGKSLDHSTDTGSIKVNPECVKKEYTMVPDFEARYSVLAGEGTYEMTLTAETKNGSYTIVDSFQAKEVVPFDVERTTNTRIFPPLRYPVLFNIVAQEDFKGQISEVVPESFDVGVIENMEPFHIQTIPSKIPTEEPVSTRLDLPFSGLYEMTQGFGEDETDPLLAEKYKKYGVVGHDGIDYALPTGTPVLAVDDGIVVRAKEKSDYGTTIILQHPWGRSYYGHLSEMTPKEGDIVKRGEQIGLSGNTGLSTGPHLHFGIKLTDNDPANGYYGKTNPKTYLADSGEHSEVAGIATSAATLRHDAGDGVHILTWDVDVKKGDTIKLGYTYLSPPESPQFYTLGPMEFISPAIASGSASTPQQTVFKETRKWQIAVDADGSGTNSVSPSTGTVSALDQTYVFTFTSTEAATSTNAGGMGSGQIQIQVPTTPDTFVAPQGSAGSAGYTTAVGNGGAVVANVVVAADSLTPTGGAWSEDDTDMCAAVALNTTTFIEGTGSISCTPEGGNGPDATDSWGFDYSSNQNWSTACNGGACTTVGYWARSTGTGGSSEFELGSGTNVSTPQLGANCAFSITSANTWEYKVCDISGLTLTTVRSLGWVCTAAACDPYGGQTVFIDEILVGPGIPTFSVQNANIRVLTATTGQTITVTYGSGGGTSGVDNPSTPGTYTFTTRTKTQVDGTLSNINSSPTIQLCTGTCGPTNDQLMRHGSWFSSGVELPFTF